MFQGILNENYQPAGNSIIGKNQSQNRIIRMERTIKRAAHNRLPVPGNLSYNIRN